ncbi:hypothetical protein [Nocardia sp. NPDC051570]|uniref:hypothetical protein n=1 Tax=Nocardia sp. NPDC051570 TaxID=3364324 RepID=UPI0037A3498D
MRDFPEPGSTREILVALDRMVEDAGYDEDYFTSERVKAGIIMLANGSLTKFRSAVDLAETDWRDLLVAAGLAHEDWPARLDAELGPADGGAS